MKHDKENTFSNRKMGYVSNPIEGIRRLARYQPIDSVELRREITGRTIELEDYPF
ncbi:hypothetical protein ACFLZT_08345 [Thermodesulfobacteriota bacterium]